MNLFSISSLILSFSGFIFSFIIYRADKNNRINKAWFYSCISFSLWALGLSGVTLSGTAETAMYWQYLLDVSAIFLPYLYLIFILELLHLQKKIIRNIFLAFASILTILSFTTFFKVGMTLLYGFYWISPGQYYNVFPTYFASIALITIGVLIQQYFKADRGSLLRAQSRNMIIGGIIGYAGGLTNFFPQLFSIYPFGNYLVIFYIVFMVYGVLRYKMLSTKVVSAQIFSAALILVSLFNLLKSTELVDGLLNLLVLIFVSIFSIFLLNSVKKEIAQREKIEELAVSIKSVNNILSHDIKGVLGKNRAVFSEMLQGTFGVINDESKNLLKQLSSDTDGVLESVMNILTSGQEIKLKPEMFDFKMSLFDIVWNVKKQADDKGITMDIKVDESQDYNIMGDKNQLETHVIRNLLENAVNYTPAGSVTVNLSKKDPSNILLTVKDTGVGITEEDKAKLFKEGGHGVNSIKVNVHSTGYGLFIAKKITDAHKGKIWVESEGQGKGSTFFVTLPIA